jgi:DUF971 family protein
MRIPLKISSDAAARQMTLHWPTGKVQRLAHAGLRAACPCAACRRERLDNPTLASSPDVTLIAIEPMGYGVQLAFSDGHARGIYPWRYLELLGCDAPVACLCG